MTSRFSFPLRRGALLFGLVLLAGSAAAGPSIVEDDEIEAALLLSAEGLPALPEQRP